MAFLGVKELNEIQRLFKVVDPFDQNRVKNGAYELSLGTEVYITNSKTGRVEIIDKAKNRQVDILPGQFALLLTEEKVHIPKDKIAFISIKAGEKLKGLVNVSGFHVDPGFNDHLLFSVYNASPSKIILNCGEPYFPIWFAELKTELETGQEYGKDNEHYKKLDHIPSKYIEHLSAGELPSPNSLLDKIKSVESQLAERIIILDEKRERNDWLLKILIGVTIAIIGKNIYDWTAYNRGYEDGKNSRIIKEQILEEAKNGRVDSIFLNKIDSILNKKNIYDTAR